LVSGLNAKVDSAVILATGEKIKTSAVAGGVAVSVPTVAPGQISSTIVLKLETPLQTN